MSVSSNPVDFRQRQRCLQPEHSFSVRAPAGSGKTELLTQRVLVLLARVQKPEEILCITFTRKAAAEMLDRILKALRRAAETEQPAAGYEQQAWQLARQALSRDRQQGWQLLDNPSRLRIITIDGLCARLTKSLPAQSQFGAQPETLQDPYPLYQLAVQRLLQQLESDGAVAAALEQLLAHLDNRLEVVERLLIAMLSKREQWLALIGAGGSIGDARDWLEQALQRLLHEELGELLEQLQPCASTIAELADYAADNLSNDRSDKASSPSLLHCHGLLELPPASPSGLPQWRGISELMLTEKGEWRRSIDKRHGFPAGSNKAEKEHCKARKTALLELIALLTEQPGLLDRLARVRSLPPDSYSNGQWALLEALTLLLPNLVAQLLVCFTEQGAVDYPQITQAALTALGDEECPTDLSLILDYQIRHVLVDEFQDTSTPQISLLKKLTRGWQADDGRTLFIVGDGMQSCYGFRDANVGLFLDSRKHGIGDIMLEAADLCVNFRSQQGIVDWVNRVFAGAFPAKDDISRGAVSYEPSQAFNGGLAGQAVTTDIFAGFADRQAEAQRVVTLVQQARAAAPDDSVAILVRNRSHLRQILPALRDAGLRWQATDLDTLASRMWVVDLVSLLRALLNPADRIAWLAILRAPWCGLSNADLLAVAGLEGKDCCLWNRLQNAPGLALSADGRARVERLLQVLTPSWRQRQRKPLRTELEGAWLALGGAASLQSESQLQDVQRVFELLDGHDRGGQLQDFELFQRDLERLYAAPDSDADPRLQVMTIHKSKGLEFDTVILAGLDRGPRTEDKELLLWQQRLTADGQQDLLLGPLAATGDDDDPLYQYLRQEQALKNRMEGTRLLYVGATRAVNRLYLLAHLKLDSRTGNPKAPASRSLLASIWPFIAEEASVTLADTDDDAAQQLRTLGRLQRLAADFLLPELDPEQPLAGQFFTPPSATERTSATPAHEDAALQPATADNLPVPNWQETRRHIGTLTHRILRQLVINQQLYLDCDNFSGFHAGWARQLLQLGVPLADCDEAVAQIDQLLGNILSDPTGRWIIDPGHRHSACELALSYCNGFQTLQLEIDRTFVDASNTRWIIDYKTAALAPGQSVETFLAEEETRYHSQLLGYARAFRALEPNPIRTALYFPESGYFHELQLKI